MSSLRELPKVDVLARDPLLAQFPERVRTAAARLAIGRLRDAQKAGLTAAGNAAELAVMEAQAMSTASLRRVVNMSGVVLHTGLGRARLAKEAEWQLAEVARDHSVSEFDLDTGRRGDRQSHTRELLCQLTKAEDALVVNNAAAGVFLALTTLCGGREVILSRGQMVEIGGSFRLPDIIRQSGCRLVEVGCTNKTRLEDYRAAISAETGAILRCHPSNFKIVGFTEEPSLDELAELARAHEVPLIDDLGSGCLVDTTRFGLSRQATIKDSVTGGADVSISSGDKLLGGPQAGLIVGSKVAIGQIRSHPLARIVRVDKLCLAALEATLRLYSQGREQEIPTIRYLSRSPDEVHGLADAIAAGFAGLLVKEGITEVGGGSAPGEGLPSWRVGLPWRDPERAAKALRNHSPPVVGWIENGTLWLDARMLEPEEVLDVRAALGALFQEDPHAAD